MHRFPKNYNYEKDDISTVETFKNFTPNFNLFAAAGFYFSRGSLYCCACSLRLRNWMSIRNPLIAHSILSPHCRFLLREKGPIFIHDVRQTYVKDWSEDTLTCVICYSRYIDNFTGCGHTYCSTCLRKLHTCPLCKYPITHYATNSTGLQFF